MKIHPLSKNQPPADTVVPEAGQTTVLALASKRPEIEPAIKWLHENGANPGTIIDAVLAKLSLRGRHLPRDQRLVYAAKVVLGEFLMRWAFKHQGTTVKKLAEQKATSEAELRPFYLALIAAGNEQTFRRIIPRLARQKTVAEYGGDVGNAQDFSCFVVDYSAVLAHRFLSNFNPNVFNAAAKAVKYIEMTAVSHYLHVGMQVSREIPGLCSYLDQSKRMDQRTKLAAKLAYIPSSLSPDERRALREKYGMDGSFVRRMKIKDVANLLGYPNAAVVSRKLYRTRQWIRNKTWQVEPVEVQY